MLLAITGMFEKKDTNLEELSNKCVSVRSPDELNSLEKIIVKGPVTYIFVHVKFVYKIYGIFNINMLICSLFAQIPLGQTVVQRVFVFFCVYWGVLLFVFLVYLMNC